MNPTILEEAYPVIDKLAKSRSVNGAFAYFEPEDIYQEIWRMCLEALERYDQNIGPVENYLVTHVTNRLKNLKRDKYFRPGYDLPSSGLAAERMNLVNALPLSDNGSAEKGMMFGCASDNTNPLDKVLCDETLIYIRDRLPNDMLEPFELLITNHNIEKSSVDEVRGLVAEILIGRDCDVKY